jgi:hypothetical protein
MPRRALVLWRSPGLGIDVMTCAPPPPSSPAAQHAGAGIIEIELGRGCCVRVDRDAPTPSRCNGFLSFSDHDYPDPERLQGLDRHCPH